MESGSLMIHGSCAEYVTIGAAISAGERDFDTIVAAHHDKSLNCVIPPCRNCGQILYEYCPDIKVIVNNENGNLIKVKAKDWLPIIEPPPAPHKAYRRRGLPKTPS